jgi:lactate racemase
MPGHAKVTLIEKGKLKKIDDPAAAIRRALSEPIKSPSLDELARGRRHACILICDITRPVPNHILLRPMVETLVASGIPLNGITILVATGLHRPNLGEELAELVGDP